MKNEHNLDYVLSSYSAVVAADVFSSCWESAAAPAGLVGGLSGPQEKTTSQTARSPRSDSRSVLTRIHNSSVFTTHFHPKNFVLLTN